MAHWNHPGVDSRVGLVDCGSSYGDCHPPGTRRPGRHGRIPVPGRVYRYAGAEWGPGPGWGAMRRDDECQTTERDSADHRVSVWERT